MRQILVKKCKNAFSASVTLPTFNHFAISANIFSCSFRLLHFPSIIPVVSLCSIFSLLITWSTSKRLPGVQVFCLWLILLSPSRNSFVWFLCSPSDSWHSPKEPNLCCLQFLLYLFWNCPGLASTHQNGFYIELFFLFLFFFSYRFHSDVTVSFFYLASSIFFFWFPYVIFRIFLYYFFTCPFPWGPKYHQSSTFVPLLPLEPSLWTFLSFSKDFKFILNSQPILFSKGMVEF